MSIFRGVCYFAGGAQPTSALLGSSESSTEEVDRSSVGAKARSVRAAPESSKRPCGRRGFSCYIGYKGT